MSEKIEQLTPEQEAAAVAFAERYETIFLGGDDRYDPSIIRDGVDFLYALIDLPSPEVVICPSPLDIIEAARLAPGETIEPISFGYDAGWTAFYDYMQTVLGVPYEKEWEFDRWRDFITKSGVFGAVFFTHVAFVCLRPCLVQRDADGSLHCETGPAIAWRDGYKEYFVHGVAVEEEFVLTPATQLDPVRWVVKEQNAERRREAVRKIGPEKVCAALNARVIDRGLDHAGQPCELLLLDLGDGRSRPYLKMRNPSLGIYHLEGRPPETRTITEALRAQQPPQLRALPVREDGVEWYQQGDVFIWPRSARAIKPKPVKLT